MRGQPNLLASLTLAKLPQQDVEEFPFASFFRSGSTDTGRFPLSPIFPGLANSTTVTSKDYEHQRYQRSLQGTGNR